VDIINYSAAVCSDRDKMSEFHINNFYLNGMYVYSYDNDERILYRNNPSGSEFIFGVFDGLGDETYAREASLITAQTVKKYHDKIKMLQARNDEKNIANIITEANEKMKEYSKKEGFIKLGSTFCAMAFKNDVATVYNIGNTSAFMLRDKELIKLSTDDLRDGNSVASLGNIYEETSAKLHISKPVEVKGEDVFFICTNGFLNFIDTEDIIRIVNSSDSSYAAVQKLMKEIRSNGNHEEGTLMLIKAGDSLTLGARLKKKKKKKQRLFKRIVALVVALILLIVSFNLIFGKPKEKKAKDILIDSVVITKNISELKINDSGKFEIEVTPENASEKVKFTSSDENVLLVTEDGEYLAKSSGKCSVTLSSKKYTHSFDITIINVTVGVSVSNKNLTLNVGEEKQIEFEESVERIKDNLIYSSLDSNIASVDNSGLIKAQNAGSTEVYVKYNDFTETVYVQVLGADEETQM